MQPWRPVDFHDFQLSSFHYFSWRFLMSLWFWEGLQGWNFDSHWALKAKSIVRIKHVQGIILDAREGPKPWNIMRRNFLYFPCVFEDFKEQNAFCFGFVDKSCNEKNRDPKWSQTHVQNPPTGVTPFESPLEPYVSYLTVREKSIIWVLDS